MAKVTLIGAGSVIFSKHIISDSLSYPELHDTEFVLFDIDASRLKTAEIMANHVAKAWNVPPRFMATTDPKKAFEGADYAVNMIKVGGYEPCTVTDFEIPKKYGLRQTIADTLGIGGIFRSLRTIPVMLEYGRIMEEVSPNITLLNYVNPMAMNTWAMLKATKVKTVGLCHSVQSSYRHLCEAVGVDPDEVNYTCAGINHMAFYTTLEHNGEDLYPRIKEKVHSGEYFPDWDRVRLTMLKKLGYYVAESSEHFSEYVPWFIKSGQPDLVDEYNIPLDEYITRCINQNASWDQMAKDLEAGIGFDNLQRSTEYGSRIIRAMETNTPTVIHGNVINNGLIDNLPSGCCVEVPCMIDKNGVQPLKVGSLPPHLAALIRTNINVQEMVVEAALTRKRDYIYYAAMLDPHTAAELSINQIYSLVDDMIEAHEGWLPEYK